MRLRISKKNLTFRILFYIGFIYILMRPFMQSYVSPYTKYVFMLLAVIAIMMVLFSRRYLSEIGYSELVWLIISYTYILLNAFLLDGMELVNISVSAYIFYTFPIIIMPLLLEKVDWDNVFNFVVAFGVIDAGISIIEFLTRRQMFPMSGGEGDVGMVTKAGAYIVRTYGLQGSYFILAEVLCFCGFVAFYLYRIKKKKVYLIAWIIISAGILTTGSRGYYVSYAAGWVIILLCERIVDKERAKIKSKTLICFFIAFFIVVAVAYFVLGTKFTTGNENIDVVLNRVRMIFDWEGDSANIQRVSIWKWAIDYWLESQWFGHGACCTDIRYSGYIKVTESGFLKRLVELGIIGTIIQYITMFIPLRRGIYKLRTGYLDSNCLPFIGTIVAFFIEDFVLERYTAPEYTVLLWASIAYLAYYEKTE